MLKMNWAQVYFHRRATRYFCLWEEAGFMINFGTYKQEVSEMPAGWGTRGMFGLIIYTGPILALKLHCFSLREYSGLLWGRGENM
jgi:hypothetical protein